MDDVNEVLEGGSLFVLSHNPIYISQSCLVSSDTIPILLVRYSIVDLP